MYETENDDARFFVDRYDDGSVVYKRDSPSEKEARRQSCLSATSARAPRCTQVGYTSKSRYNLLSFVRTIKRDTVPLVAHLTTCDGIDGPTGPSRVERMRRDLFEWKGEEYSEVGALWLREWKPRDKGAFVGSPGAHLHVLTYHAAGWDRDAAEAFACECGEVWTRLGGGSSEIEPERHQKAAAFYLCEVEKVTSGEWADALKDRFPAGTGAAWGTHRRELIPTKQLVGRDEKKPDEWYAEREAGWDYLDAQLANSGKGPIRRFNNPTTTLDLGTPEQDGGISSASGGKSSPSDERGGDNNGSTNH